jgi:hypothetical protein
VARPQRLSEAQIAELFDPPTEQRDLVRHFTLSEADLGAIRRCRGDHNRLGYALMLCYLRHPGRALRSGERPPPALLAFVAEQIGILPDAVDGYLAAERNRQRHAVECQEQLGLRPFGKRAAAELASALLPQAIEDDRLARLAELVMETCRQHRIVVPSPAALERLCAELRHQARPEVYRRLTDGLTAEQRRRLDALTRRREETSQNWLTWLRQMPEAAIVSSVNPSRNKKQPAAHEEAPMPRRRVRSRDCVTCAREIPMRSAITWCVGPSVFIVSIRSAVGARLKNANMVGGGGARFGRGVGSGADLVGVAVSATSNRRPCPSEFSGLGGGGGEQVEASGRRRGRHCGGVRDGGWRRAKCVRGTPDGCKETWGAWKRVHRNSDQPEAI